jgi:MFS family permease
MKELFQNKNYVLLFWGFLVSELGNVVFGFAAGLYIADLTGKASMLGIFMALGAGVRIIMSPVAGALVDRWNKVRIIYLTDYFRGIIFVVTAYLFYNGLTQNEATWVLLIVVSLSGFISAFFGPAVASGTPEIVGLDKMQAANGANSIIQSITGIAGVLIGIIAFSLFSFEVAVVINGVSFILSGFSEMFIKAEYKQDLDQEQSHGMISDIKFGFTYLKNTYGLLNLMIFSLFLNFALSPMFSVGIPSLMRIQLSRNAWEIGWLNIAFSVAMLVSGVIIGNMALKSYARTIRINLLTMVVTFLLLSVTIYLLTQDILQYSLFYGLFIVLHILIAVTMIGSNIPLNTGMVKVIDARYRGRVFATISALSQGLIPVSILLAGFLVDATSVSFLGIVCSVLLLIPTIGFFLNKPVKALLEQIDKNEKNGIESRLSTE